MAPDKTTTREYWRSVRRDLAARPEDPDIAAASREHLLATLVVHLASEAAQGRSVVALYSGVGSELDPSPLAQLLPQVGGVPAFPRVRDLWLDFAIGMPRGLEPGHRDIPEPIGPPVQAHAIAAIIVPGIAFTAAGHRLGQGGGHYDRTLGQLRRSASPPLFIGLCRQGQVAAELPVEEHDQAVDGLVTEAGFAPVR